MLAEFIDKITSLAIPTTSKYDGRDYVSKQIFPVKAPAPKELVFNNLDSLLHLAEETEGKPLLVVDSYNQVSLYGEMDKVWNERNLLARAVVLKPENPFVFGKQYDPESFIVALQAHFVRDDNLKALLTLCSTMGSEIGMEMTDNGISQNVTTRTGIVMKSRATVPNPVTLAPIRTFFNIEQIHSEFVFRVKRDDGQGITCALYDSFGSYWQHQAKAEIGNYLKKGLEFRNAVSVRVLE